MSASLAADQMAAGSLPLIDQPDEPRRRRKALAFLVLLFGLLALIVTIASYLLFRQPINPLPPVPVSQLPTYSTSIYGMTRPVGVAVSASGDRIYVTQGGAATEGVVLDARGEVVGRMVPPADSGTDHQPVYAAVDPITSEVYVSDRMAGTIYVFDRDGGYRREFVPDGMAGWQPLGLSFDRSGHLFVTDLALGQVLEFDRDGAVVRAIGATRTLNFPNGVSISSDGLVFVTDSNNGRLFAYADDAIIAQVGRGAGEGNLGLPRGLAVDASGRIFIVDTTAQRVFVYAVPEGIVIPGRAIDFAGWFGGRTFIGDPAVHDPGQSTVDFTSARLDYIGSFGVQGIADGRFQFPNSVAVDGRGRVYVADTFNDRIQIWSY